MRHGDLPTDSKANGRFAASRVAGRYGRKLGFALSRRSAFVPPSVSRPTGGRGSRALLGEGLPYVPIAWNVGFGESIAAILFSARRLGSPKL